MYVYLHIAWLMCIYVRISVYRQWEWGQIQFKFNADEDKFSSSQSFVGARTVLLCSFSQDLWTIWSQPGDHMQKSYECLYILRKRVLPFGELLRRCCLLAHTSTCNHCVMWNMQMCTNCGEPALSNWRRLQQVIAAPRAICTLRASTILAFRALDFGEDIWHVRCSLHWKSLSAYNEWSPSRILQNVQCNMLVNLRCALLKGQKCTVTCILFICVCVLHASCVFSPPSVCVSFVITICLCLRALFLCAWICSMLRI